MFLDKVLLRPNLSTEFKVGVNREMPTLATSLDFLMEGKLARCGYILLGLYMALEGAAH